MSCCKTFHFKFGFEILCKNVVAESRGKRLVEIRLEKNLVTNFETGQCDHELTLNSLRRFRRFDPTDFKEFETRLLELTIKKP